MKILLTTLEYPPFKGGAANYYENIVKNWPSYAKASDGKSELDDIFVLHNNNDKLLNNKLLFLKWLPAIFNINKEIRQKSINHVIVGNILPLGTAVWILFWFLNFKYSVVLHGTDIMYAQKSWRKKMLAKIILKNSKNIVCNSSFTAGLVDKYYAREFSNKISVVNPGIDAHVTCNMEHGIKIKEEYDLEGKFVLLSISRLIKRKGIDKVIELMPGLIKEIPNLVYVIAGGGPDEEELKKFARGSASNLEVESQDDNVIFLGQISEKDKWTWLDACDIFILPSREEKGNIEGFGIVYLEASLMGKPVVAGNHGGVSDAVIHNETGLLVDPESNQEIKNAILKLYKNVDLRKELGTRGKERAVKEFSSKNRAKEIFDKII